MKRTMAALAAATLLALAPGAMAQDGRGEGRRGHWSERGERRGDDGGDRRDQQNGRERRDEQAPRERRSEGPPPAYRAQGGPPPQARPEGGERRWEGGQRSRPEGEGWRGRREDAPALAGPPPERRWNGERGPRPEGEGWRGRREQAPALAGPPPERRWNGERRGDGERRWTGGQDGARPAPPAYAGRGVEGWNEGRPPVERVRPGEERRVYGERRDGEGWRGGDRRDGDGRHWGSGDGGDRNWGDRGDRRYEGRRASADHRRYDGPRRFSNPPRYYHNYDQRWRADWRRIPHGRYFHRDHAIYAYNYYRRPYRWYGDYQWSRWHRPWRVGYALPRHVRYYDVPYGFYSYLPPPPRGCRYIYADGDILLIALASLIVIDALVQYDDDYGYYDDGYYDDYGW